MTFLRALAGYTWRLTRVASAAALLVGGPMHPASYAEDPLGDELAILWALQQA
jgi:hypothetical protein